MKRRNRNRPNSVSRLAISESLARKDWSKLEHVDHPPGRAGAGTGHGAEDEDHDRRAEQGVARVLGFEFAQQLRHQEGDDREGAEEHDLLAELDLRARPTESADGDEDQAAAEDPPVGT
jgi:hypothetical protein